MATNSGDTCAKKSPVIDSRRLRCAERHAAKLKLRQQRAIDRGDMRAARMLGNKLIQSFDAKIVAADKAARHHRVARRLRREAIAEIAATMSAVRAPAEPFTVYAKPKAKWPEYRPIHSFGLRNHARQLLVKEALSQLLPVTSRQFGTRNGGWKEAVRRVADAVGSRRYKFVATCDLKSFFASIDRSWLRQQLPTGAKVVASTLLAEGSPLIRYRGVGPYKPCMTTHELARQSRRGLPQGASTSPTIADFITALALRGITFAADVHVTNIADDFAILGPTRKSVVDAANSLRDAFGRHQAGGFEMTIETRRVDCGFDFIGYHFCRAPSRLQQKPHKENVERFHQRLRREVVAIAQGDGPDALGRWLVSWRNAFRHGEHIGLIILLALRRYCVLLPDIAPKLISAGRKIARDVPDVRWQL